MSTKTIIITGASRGLGLAIDNTAGERERRSLEPLLINPVTRTALIFGKWLAASALAGAGMIITLGLCLAAMLALPIDELGLNFTLTTGQVLMLLIAILPIPMFASSLQLLLGLFAKSFEAEMASIFGREALQKIPNSHPLYSSYFRFTEPPTTAFELNGWGDDLVHDYLKGIEIDGRLGVLYSNKDYGCEWDYDWRNKRFLAVDNTRFAVNIVIHALTN